MAADRRGRSAARSKGGSRGAVRLRAAQRSRAYARRAGVHRAREAASARDRGPRLGSLAGDPLSRRAFAVGRRWPALPGSLCPSRLYPRQTGTDVRGRERWRARDHFRCDAVRLHALRNPARCGAGQPGLRRVSHPPPHQLDARLCCVSGSLLLPRSGRGSAVRHFAARTRDQLRPAGAGGVPGFHRLLSRAAGQGLEPSHGVRPARLAECRRRLPLRHRRR